MIASLIAAVLDALLELAPDEDMHAALDAAAVRRAKALKDAADKVAFG